ncbi:MAG: PKD domain-containing protein [Bacteroidota bacterium]
MKKLLLTAVTLVALFVASALAQTGNSNSPIDSLAKFDQQHWTDFYSSHHKTQNGLAEFISSHQRSYITETFFSTQKISGVNPTTQQACTNIDFESGNLNGWNSTTGYNALYDSAGCCQSAGGAQQIVSGTGTDPCAGFPIVAPGGNSSVMLGNNGIGGIADRLEQTFAVTNSNANFTYRYAVVFEDPGHSLNDQPQFEIEMLDSNGVQLPCTYYNVAAGQNIPGFINSTSCAAIVYKPWTNVSVDLTNYIGQNVTIRFTTFDCALGGHYAYAYIDGSCTTLQQTVRDTICNGGMQTMCAPSGYATYLWNGSSVNGQTSQCVVATNPGNFYVQTTQVTGCPGPVFDYQLHNFPTPNANFNTGNSNTNCGLTMNFNNTSSMSSGTLTTHSWNFGDGNTSSLENPTHTYLNPGTYTVSLIVGSLRGCYDTTEMAITVNPQPAAVFTFNNGCELAPVTFNDISNIQQGVINQWEWVFGDGSIGSGQNVSHTYANSGIYTVSLTITSNFGCSSSQTQTIVISEKPNANFITNQASACTHTIGFINTSNVSAGSVTNSNWNYGDGNTSSSQNGLNYYANTGTYNVQLIVSSDMGCTDTAIIPVTISPLPTPAFSANSVCLNGTTSFTNSSSVSSGFITITNWQFGDGNQSFQNQPLHQYLNAGTYNVTLNITTNSNCSNTITIPVTVNPLPFAAFSATNVCEGNILNFLNNSTISSGSISNNIWDFTSNGTPDNTNQNANNYFSAYGTYTTQLMVISNLNCSSTYTALVTVYPKPVVQFSSMPVCQGQPTSFTNQTTIPNGQIINYSWSFGDNTTQLGYSPIHQYSTAGNYNVVLTVTSDYNCTNSVSHSAIIHPKPIVNFQSTTACLNQATQFNNQSTISSGSIIKYRWDFESNGSVDDSTASPSHVYPNAGTMQSRLIAISNNNCTNQNTNPVIVHYNPVANFSAPSTCIPAGTQFNNLSSSIDGAITSYGWDFNGDNLTDNNQQNPQYIFTQVGNYGVKLEVQTQYGCVNTIIKSVYVNATPSAVFSAQNNIGCPLLCVNFVNNSTIGSGNIVTNQWIFGDNSAPDYTKNPGHCYSTGNYNVTLKIVSDSGCISSSTLPNLVKVYSNPVANFNITPTEVEITTPLIEVEDMSVGASSVKYIFNDGTIKNTRDFSHLFNTMDAKTVAIMQTVSNSYGCNDSVIKIVIIKPAYTIYIPNAFTPNSDGLNDGFKAEGVGIAQFKLQVFDRWGKMIFESDDINKSWDGSVNGKGNAESTKSDVYVWKAEVIDVLKEHHSMIGHVTLLK